MPAILKIILLLFIFFIAFPACSYTQLNNSWYFGIKAGLNFNTDPPTALTDGQLDTREGNAGICDRNGNILFYTNGVVVYNRHHQLMANSDGLLGHASSLNAAVIVPRPGSRNIFYIFSTDGLENNSNNGYRYSEVNMDLDGGNGAITSQKNILLHAPSTERIAAVRHANGIDYWLMTKIAGYNNNVFSAYKIDCSGVSSTPVNSTAGFSYITEPEFGGFKFSPDSKKLAMSLQGHPGTAQIFDFDNATGIISNAILLKAPVNQFSRIYGMEFSPDSRLFYCTANFWNFFNIIYQYDISAHNEVLANNSRVELRTAAGEVNLGMQMGPDLKIYIALPNSPSLSVINDPNVYGAGCNIVSNAISLNGRLCQNGLPAPVSNFVAADKIVDFTRLVTGCRVQLNGSSTFPSNIPWLWNLGDGNTASGQQVNHVYSTPGTYQISLRRPFTTTCGNADTLMAAHTIIIEHSGINVFAGNDTVVLAGLPFTLKAISNTTPASYSWSPATGLNNASLPMPVANLQQDRTYRVTATGADGCKATDDVAIKVVAKGNIYVPSAFTPNNDGINDDIKPIGMGLKDIKHFEIFNRYGQMVFKTSVRASGWNGFYKGKPQPVGSYTYILKAENYDGRIIEEKGHILLLH